MLITSSAVSLLVTAVCKIMRNQWDKAALSFAYVTCIKHFPTFLYDNLQQIPGFLTMHISLWICLSGPHTYFPWSINSLQIQVFFSVPCVTPLRWWSQPEWLKNQYSNRQALYLISFMEMVVWPKQLLGSAACYRNITVSDEQLLTPKWDVNTANNPKARLLISLHS